MRKNSILYEPELMNCCVLLLMKALLCGADNGILNPRIDDPSYKWDGYGKRISEHISAMSTTLWCLFLLVRDIYKHKPTYSHFWCGWDRSNISRSNGSIWQRFTSMNSWKKRDGRLASKTLPHSVPGWDTSISYAGAP